MYRFFVSPEQLLHEPIRISGEDYNHIHNVLRMKTGEEVLVTDQGEKEYLCEIADYDTDAQEVQLRVVDVFGSCRQRSFCFRDILREIRWNRLYRRQLN